MLLRGRALLIRGALLFLSVILALVALDVVLRVFSLGTPRRGVLTPKPQRHMLNSWIEVFQPGYAGTLSSGDFKVIVQMNSLGLREREVDVEALREKRPVLLLGDSYFFGWGVEQEERVSEQLDGMFRGDGEPAPVVNFSFPGWSTSHYVELWDQFVVPLKPRAVVVSCFVGNDFTDDLKHATRKDLAATPAVAGAAGTHPGSASPDSCCSLYQCKLAVREALSTSPLVGTANQLLWKSQAFRHFFNRLEMRNDRIVLYEKKSSELQDRLYHETKLAYSKLARLSRESGIPVLVVLIPDHLQILSPDLFQDVDLRRPQREIVAHLASEGLACLDLLPLFEQSEHPERCFFREDKHWNAAGHKFVADAVLPVIRQLSHTPESASR